MHGLRRLMFQSQLREFLGYFPCVAIIGPRQCGKTTLVKDYIDESWKFFDMEKRKDQELVSQDPDLFLKLNKDHVVIDEAQLLPSLFPALRVAIDDDRTKKGRFIISGSSSPELLKNISESLAGRIAIIEMGTFSLREMYQVTELSWINVLQDKLPPEEWASILKPKLTLSEIHTHWLFGSYPEPRVEHDLRYYDVWYENYFDTYIHRDILMLFPKLNFEKYKLFIKGLIYNSGQILNYSIIGQNLGINAQTIKDYFNIAHGTFIWRNIPAFSSNLKKRLIKHPKGILRDSGMLHHRLNLRTIDDLLSHPMMGHSWEGFVTEQILGQFTRHGEKVDYYHYRTSNHTEVDLILETGYGVVPIEIKYNQSVKLNQLKGLNNFIEDFDCKFGIVVNNDESIRQYNEKIWGLPLSHLI